MLYSIRVCLPGGKFRNLLCESSYPYCVSLPRMIVLSDRLLQVVLYVFTICIVSDNMKDASEKAIYIVKYHSAMICHRRSICMYMESVRPAKGDVIMHCVC